MPPLETVKLEGVSVMAAGGPYRGKGSPPAGDFFDVAKLQQIADASNALHDAGELRPVNKIGHDPNQRMLRNSGISDGEHPAAGWLRNFRVDGDKLKADIENVPKKLAELIKAGAYRTRSAELRTLESQTGDRATGPAVTGLAWLGAVGPAIRNLDDVYAYYADHADLDDDVIVVDYSEEPAPWQPDRGFRWVQAQVDEQLPDDSTFYVADVGPSSALVVEYRYNPSQKRAHDGKWTDGPGGHFNSVGRATHDELVDRIRAKKPPKLTGAWGRREGFDATPRHKAAAAQLKNVDAEIARKEARRKSAGLGFAEKDDLDEELRRLKRRRSKLQKAMKGPSEADWKKSYEEVAWVVDFEIDEDKLTLAPREDWILAEPSWTEATRDFIDASERVTVDAADTTGVSEITLSEEQVKAFADQLGLDEEEVTAEAITEALAAKPEPVTEGERKYSDEDLAKLEADAKLGVQANTKLYEMEREGIITAALSDKKFKPADKDTWVTRYDESPELVKSIIAELPKDEESGKEFGSDDAGDTIEEVSEREFEQFADYLGIEEHDRAGVKREAAA